ncbi:unnamed protein product [Cuscuta campestris]|uniref:Retrotransposon gag domain-containing protein n=1 Tax=Cuscuta campestris TaxID=132261 RepID=A0A484L6X7_9ASTE|nr:unnamed protein product [Cuscuta campestris]
MNSITQIRNPDKGIYVICKMSQETAHRQGNNKHVSVHTEASSFTPIQNEPINQQNVSQNNANAGGQPDYAILVFLENLLQQVANAPMFQPPPSPPPLRVITFKTLKDNRAKEFLGNRIAEPRIAWNWIERTTRVLRDLNVPLNDHPRLATQLLCEEAYEWWKHTDESDETPKPRSWEFFDWTFKKEYIPPRFREEKRTEFFELRQGDMMLPEYRQTFVSLAKFALTLVSTTTERIEEFKSKLQPDLRAQVSVIPTVDFTAVYNLIAKADKDLNQSYETTNMNVKSIYVIYPHSDVKKKDQKALYFFHQGMNNETFEQIEGTTTLQMKLGAFCQHHTRYSQVGRPMDPQRQRRRRLAALLSSSIADLLSLLLILFPPTSNPLPLNDCAGNGAPTSDPRDVIFPDLLLHLLFTSEISATLSLLSFLRKRRRVEPADVGDPESTIARLLRGDSVKRRNPDSFKQFFNMNSSTFEWLCGLLEPLLECRDPVDSPLNLSAGTRLGIGLFRLASGADFREISDQFRVPISVSQFCVKQLCRVLCTNFRFWVGFPSPNELGSVSSQFYSLTGIPNCCGAIQCARFKIRRNREKKGGGEETIAAQIIVDSSSRILSIIAGFHGQKTDPQILKSSTLYKDIEKGALLNSQPVCINGVDIPQFFAGEGAYPLLPWLMIPFTCSSSPGSNEEKFNSAHRIVLLSALKAIASLRKWGVLNRSIEVEDKVAVAYIGASSILHNMLLMRGDFSAFFDELDECSWIHCQSSQPPLEENNGVEEIFTKRMAFASTIRDALAKKVSEQF